MAQAGYVRNARAMQLATGSRRINKSGGARAGWRAGLREAACKRRHWHCTTVIRRFPTKNRGSSGSGLTHAVRALPKNKHLGKQVPGLPHCCSSGWVAPWLGLLYRSTYFACLTG